MKKVSLKNLKKGAPKGLLSRFRKEERGAITLEIAIAFSFLGFGFVGLMSTVTSIDNAHAGEQALNDIVMTVRAMSDVDAKTNSELGVLFSEIAADNLRSTQFAQVEVERSCGCPLQNTYNEQMCSVEACDDGSEPGRYLELAMSVRPTNPSSNADVIETFNYQATVRYDAN